VKWSVTDQPCSWAKENKAVIDDVVAPKSLNKFCHYPVIRMPHGGRKKSTNYDENEGLKILMAGKSNRRLSLCN
jgi:hypothetical protein